MDKIKVIVVDDHKMFRDLLVKDLETERVTVIGEATNGVELLELLKSKVPDVVVLDLNMPVMAGGMALPKIKRLYPSIRVIILSSDYSEFFITETIIDGASAYLQKNSFVGELVEAIITVHTEDYYFNELMTKETVSQLKKEKKIYYSLGNEKFSEREIEVLIELCKDLTPEQVADNLNISANTVRFHKSNLLRKTQSETMISLVKYAIKQGIIPDGKN